VKIALCVTVGYSHLKIESSFMTRVRDIDMTREIRLSLTAKSIPRLIQPLVRCKICKKKANSYFATSTGGFILFCEPCFETFNVFYKREIRHREEQGIILEDELEKITQKALGSRTKRK
jgi:hypothetical protein